MADKPATTPKTAKVSTVDPNETKAAKFLRLGKPRVNAALKSIDIVGNLSGSGYEYTAEQVAAIRKALEVAVEKTMAKFDTKKKDGGPAFDF